MGSGMSYVMRRYLYTAPMPGRQRNRPLVDYSGETFGRLTAVSMETRADKWGSHRWLFRCSCGNTTVASIKDVRSGHTRSCGCLFVEMMTERNTTHGLSNRPEYRCWKDMWARCTNPRNKEFKNYGGRGITVCDRWRDFAAFYADMGPAPDAGTIERREVDGNYEPTNCEWATWKAQANNKRTSRKITIGGVTRTLAQWCELYGIEPSKVRYRLKVGMPPEEAFLNVDRRK